MGKYRINIIASAILLAFSIFMLAVAIPREISTASILGASTGIDSRWFPSVVTALIGLLSFSELVSNICHLVKEKAESGRKPEAGKGSLKGELRAIAVFVLFILYALAFRFIGFIPATIIFPAITLFVIGGRKWQYYLSFYLVAAITYVLFVYVIGITIR